MKYIILFTCLISVVACKEEEQQQASDGSAPTTHTMIQSSGCGVAQTNASTVTITCADGSTASVTAPTGPVGAQGPTGATGARGSFSLKDIHGTAYPHLTFLGSDAAYQGFYNQTSGDVLIYGNDGNLLQATAVFFDGPSCTGQAFINNSPSQALTRFQGAIFLNENAWPTAHVQALKTTGVSTTAISASMFAAGTCSNHVTSASNAQPWMKVSAVPTLDSSDPQTMAGPVQLVLSN